MDVFANYKKTKDYLVCIDSDGCILNNMELKHKECFCPATVNVWDLQNISKYARESAEFVNLYSRGRGTNRFPALIRTIDLLFQRTEVMDTGVTKLELQSLRDWVATTNTLSATALSEYCKDSSDEVLQRAIAWSREVDANVEHIVRNIRPFPHVKEAIRKLGTFADVVVVSATPNEALRRELHACGVDELVSVICGQEAGTKAQCIAKAMSFGYEPNNVLKIGDAPGDLHAADQNGVLFYPIIPGSETESWVNMLNEMADSFLAGTYAGNHMEAFKEQFLQQLPENPRWEM